MVYVVQTHLYDRTLRSLVEQHTKTSSQSKLWVTSSKTFFLREKRSSPQYSYSPTPPTSGKQRYFPLGLTGTRWIPVSLRTDRSFGVSPWTGDHVVIRCLSTERASSCRTQIWKVNTSVMQEKQQITSNSIQKTVYVIILRIDYLEVTLFDSYRNRERLTLTD